MMAPIPYVYGLDAYEMLTALKASTGKAMFGIGDSRLYGIAQNGELNQWNPVVPIGGASQDGLTVLATGGLWAQTAKQSIVANTVMASTIYAAENVNDYSMRPFAIESVVASAAATVEPNVLWNRLCYTSLDEVNVPWLTLMPGKIVDAFGIYRKTPTGVAANNISFRGYTGGRWSGGAPSYQATAMMPQYSAAKTTARAQVTFPADANWVNVSVSNHITCDLFWSWGSTLTVLNETFCAIDGIWLETNDQTGLVYHDMAVGGALSEDYVDVLTGVRVANQHPASAWERNFELRCGYREPWFLLDLGSNGASFGINQSAHEAILIRIIEKFRQISKNPNAKVILTTAYPGNSGTVDSPAGTYYSKAAIAVASRMRNVMCIDTYKAAADGGGYATAVANGWFGGSPDGTHRVASGRAARAAMFAAIVSGAAWTWSSTLG
jgi:hypothetical protein